MTQGVKGGTIPKSAVDIARPIATSKLNKGYGTVAENFSDLNYIPTCPGDAPFTCKDLSETVFGVSDAVLSYEVKESESIRYKQSYCVRIESYVGLLQLLFDSPVLPVEMPERQVNAVK